MADRSRAPALEIRALNVYYGASHALQGVDLSLKGGVLSVVGRNGMGKTTLCKAIMGLVPVASGSINFAGQSLIRPRAGRHRPARHRVCATGPAVMALADGRRTPAAHGRAAQGRVDHRSDLHDVPAPG